MIITFTKSFEKSLKVSSDEAKAKKSAETLIKAIENNVKPEGLGLKKLKEDIWEVRAGLHTRVLFVLFPGEIRFLLVGNHNEIKDYLKRH